MKIPECRTSGILRGGAVGAVWCGWAFLTMLRAFLYVIYSTLGKKFFENSTKKRNFHLKPQTASKFEENRAPKTLWNRKPHIKPHSKGIKTANRARNRISKSLKPQPATHCTPLFYVINDDLKYFSKISRIFRFLAHCFLAYEPKNRILSPILHFVWITDILFLFILQKYVK